MRDARRRCAAFVGALCVLASCSSEPESTAPVVELSTTTVTTLPPTTETTEAPTTTEDPRIAEVEAAVAAFRETQIELLLDPEEPIDRLESFATGDLLENNVESILKFRAEGQVISGVFSETAVGTEFIADGSARHTGCGLDALQAVAADGALLDPADEVPLLRLYTLVSDAESGWLVSLVQYPGSELTPCEL